MTQRTCLELMITALVPAAVEGLSGWIALGGRLSWLLPVLMLPLGLLLAWVWHDPDTGGLPELIDSVSRRYTALALRGIYLLWGLWLLAQSALDCTDRLLAAAQLPAGRWPLLLTAFFLTLWLGEDQGRYVRTGRIFYLSTAAALGLVGLLALPSVRWQNLLPAAAEPGGIFLGGLRVLSLAGYGIYGCCQPIEGREEKGSRWVLAGAAVLSAVTLITVGALGPALAQVLEQPFLYILKGVAVPGAFQRGEAALAAVMALADLVLLGMVARGCTSLLPRKEWSRHAVLGAGIILSILLAGGKDNGECFREIRTYGGLLVGVLIPIYLKGSKERKRRGERNTISCG